MEEQFRYFEQLLDRARERRNPRRAREAEALRRIRHASIEAGVATPPADLAKLAKHLGVGIRHVPLAVRGRVFFEKHRLVVEVNEDLDEFERRYTAAHELAHLILEAERLSLSAAMGAAGRQAGSFFEFFETEYLCDLGAEELLLPTQWLRDELRGTSPSLRKAVELANRAKCDLDFVARRAAALGLWACLLLWFEKSGDQVWVKRAFPSGHKEDLLTWNEPLDVSLVHNCFVEDGFPEGTIKFKICGEEHTYGAQCARVDPSTVLALLPKRAGLPS